MTIREPDSLKKFTATVNVPGEFNAYMVRTEIGEGVILFPEDNFTVLAWKRAPVTRRGTGYQRQVVFTGPRRLVEHALEDLRVYAHRVRHAPDGTVSPALRNAARETLIRIDRELNLLHEVVPEGSETNE